MGQLEDMRMFNRVVEAGSISRAAEQMDVAKSAISRRLSRLETRLGVSLLNRTTRSSSLTDAGRAYYEEAAKILTDVAELDSVIGDANCELSGSLRLAAPLSFGVDHLTPAIDEFAKLHADLNIEIDFSDRQIDLVEEGFDIAFRIATLKDSNLMARYITPIKLIFCASPGYLHQHGEPRSVQELKNHQFLRYNISDSNSFRIVDEQGKEHLLKLTGKISANNGGFLRDMAIAGHGILTTPTFISWQAIASGDLVPILRDYQLPSPNAYAVYPKTRYLSRRARVLIDFLVERFGDNPYWDQF